MRKTIETNYRPSLWCSLFGHKWRWSNWEPATRSNGEKGWRRTQECKRCGSETIMTTSGAGKPLDVVERS